MAFKNDWTAYNKSLKGEDVIHERGAVPSGYWKRPYRDDARKVCHEGIALWRDTEGTLLCQRTTRWTAPTDPDEIEELFAGCLKGAIPKAVYDAVKAGQPWPDEVVLPAEEEGDANLTPLERVSKQIAALRAQAAEWYKSIRGEDGKGAISTKVDADKAANYANEFAKLEKLAEDTRKVEKEPHRKAGEQVDQDWKPHVEAAGSAKKWMKLANETWLAAEQKRLDAEHAAKVAEANRIRLENEKAAAEAEKAGAPPPVLEAAPVIPREAPKAKAGTGGRAVSMRTRDVGEITDRKALAVWFAENNAAPEDVFNAMLAFAMKAQAAGMEVPGIKVSKATGAV